MKTVIGIDYGTGAARAILVDVASGAVLLTHTVPYAVLPGDLADAAEYEAALWALLAAVTPAQYRHTVAGICVDATSLTLVPVDAAGTPLALLPPFAGREQAQVKLWKRHTAQAQADRALALARQLDEPFLARTGGAVSAEWTLPKLLEMREEDPQAYAAMDAALDLCEYLTGLLVGRPGGQIVRSTGSMCYKGLWSADLGFPSEQYLNALCPGFAAEYRRLLRGRVCAPGQAAGTLAPAIAARFGLPADVTVAAGLLDGHTCVAALGALHPGDAALVMGTSAVLAVQMAAPVYFAGVCGIAADGLTQGLTGIDAGQSCTGDMLQWYVQNSMPAAVQAAADSAGCTVHDLLCSQVSRPWANTLTAVDWFNGSRNAPCDLNLTGAVAGMTLATRPADIYLTLLQAIVCGTGEIIDLCAQHGVAITRLVVSGGMAEKNPLLMQQYADLLALPVAVGRIGQGPALGSAIFAAVAAGIYPNVAAAHAAMGVREFVQYTPDAEHRREYAAIRQRNHRLRCMICSDISPCGKC